MTREELYNLYIPHAEKMAANYSADDALSRAYEGLVEAVTRLPDGHPNPGGYISLYIRGKLLPHVPPVPVQMPYEPGQHDPDMLMVEYGDIAKTEDERFVLRSLLSGYTLTDIAKKRGWTRYKATTIRDTLKPRLRDALPSGREVKNRY